MTVLDDPSSASAMDLQPISLSDALRLFNRKERDILVKNALGHGQAPRLSPSFCDQIARALNGRVVVTENAWWAIDYHLSWLAGALTVYREQAIETANRMNPTAGGRWAVESNQEDIDLVIADGANLILIEAKGYGGWKVGQLKSKLDRLRLLRKEVESWAGEPMEPVQFHLLLASPSEVPESILNLVHGWAPEAASNPVIKLDGGSPLLRVGCLAASEVTQGGWRITRLRRLRSAASRRTTSAETEPP